MIKKFIMMGFVCLLSASAYSQKRPSFNFPSKEETDVSPVVKEKIEEYAVKINAIIQEEKKLMEAELSVLQNKELDKAEFNKQKTIIADRFSEKIDRRIEDLGFDLDMVIQKQVRYSLLNSDVDSKEELRERLLKKFRATKSLEGYITYGVMTLTNDLADNDLDKNIGYSNNLEFGFKFNYQFSRTSHWGLISGVGFSWRTVRLDNNMVFAKDVSTDIQIVKSGQNLDKSKLRTGYIIVPLGLQYNFSKLKSGGMDIQYRDYNKGFKIGANLYGGIRMSSNNIIKADDVNIRDRGNYQVNPLIYGAQLTFSYNDFSLFVKKDFSNYFKDSQFKNDKALVIGVGLWW